MGALIDLTNCHFGQWKVLRRATKEEALNKKGVYWLCECNCGNIVPVSGDSLRNGKSTKCMLCCNANKKNDLQGKIFGRLTVIRQASKEEHSYKNDKSAIWLCKCNCGSNKKIYVRGTDLTHNHIVSYGCYNKEMSFLKNSINMTDKIFGELTPIKATTKRRNGSVIWECQCSCGKTTFVAQSDLRSGRVESCGHSQVSKGERKIAKILAEANIPFETQKTFNDARYPDTNRLMKFDFYLPDQQLLIEYDGAQHYETVNFWDGEEGLCYRQQRDAYKTNWCQENGIKLLRIPYTKYNDITINTIISED